MSPSSGSALAEAVERARGAEGVSGEAVSPKFGALWSGGHSAVLL